MTAPWIIFMLGGLLGLACIPIGVLVVRLGRQAAATAEEFRRLSDLLRPASGVAEGSRLLHRRSRALGRRSPLSLTEGAKLQGPTDR